MLDIEKFDIKLDTNQIGRNFIYAEEVTSTNEILLSDKNLKQHGTVLLAENQTEGKGRMNRQWYSAQEMNLTFSILILDAKLLGNKINILNLTIALAVAMSIENLFQLRTELKWPNDVMIANKKVAGILLESVSSGSKIERLVIGIGLNVNQVSFQGKFNFEPTSLKKELRQNIEREKLLAEILNNFEELLETFVTKPKFILDEWRSRCRIIGQRITIAENDKTRHGIFEDINDEGFLILKSDGILETIHFGDVSIL